MPGNNVVPDEEGEKLVKSPEIAEKIEIGLFTVEKGISAPETFGDENKPPEVKAAEVISGHPEDVALGIVGDLLDMKVLRALLKIEPRQEVLYKINSKIEEINSKEDKKDGKDEESF
jgi:hypothetical protein